MASCRASAAWLTWDWNTRASGTQVPAIPATPSQDATVTARVEVALVASKLPVLGPTARADSSGKALVAIGTASTAYGTKKTAQAKLYSTSAPLPPRELASTITTATEASWAISVATPAAASARTRAPIPGGNRSAGRSRNRNRSRAAGMSGVTTSAATPAVVPAASTIQARAGTGRVRSW